MSQQTTLRVLLNTDVEATDYRYALRDDVEDTVVAEGVAEIAALPIAMKLVLVVPFSNATISKIRLPSGVKFQSPKFEQMLPAAVEDQVLSDMTQIHVVAAPMGEDELYPVVVVDKIWLRQQVDAFLRLERPLVAIVPEALFGSIEPGLWELTLMGDDSLLRTDEMSVAMVDSARSGPPIGLILRLNQLAPESRPELLRLIGSSEEVDTTGWTEDLGLPVEWALLADRPRWMVESALPSVNLATREFLPQRKKSALSWSRFRLPLILLALLIGLVAVDATVSLIRDLYRRNRLESDIQATFRRAFPDVPMTADPVAQMRSEITKLKHRVGEQGDSDFLPMLSEVSVVLARHNVARVQSMTFQTGALSCQIGKIPQEDADAILADLRKVGFVVQADMGDSGLTIRVTQ